MESYFKADVFSVPVLPVARNIARRPSCRNYIVPMNDTIDRHRQRIDELDEQILELIQQRVNEAIRIRQLKQEQNIPLFTPEREQALIQHLVDRSAGKLSEQVVKSIWNAIIQGGKRTGSI